MIPAKDIMTKNVVTIKPSTSVIEAIDLLLQNQISGLPVVDEEMNLIGVVSEKDLLNIMFEDDMNVNDPVSRYMTKKVVSFREEDDVVKICEFFLKKNYRRVPIVKDKKLSGIISRRDMLRLILISVLKGENGNNAEQKKE
jgi:CBS domain-containing protein